MLLETELLDFKTTGRLGCKDIVVFQEGCVESGFREFVGSKVAWLKPANAFKLALN